MADAESHVELVRQILTEAGVEFDEEHVGNEGDGCAKTIFTFGETHKNVDAYTGFSSSLVFDSGGRLTTVRVTEE